VTKNNNANKKNNIKLPTGGARTEEGEPKPRKPPRSRKVSTKVEDPRCRSEPERANEQGKRLTDTGEGCRRGRVGSGGEWKLNASKTNKKEQKTVDML